MNSRHKGKGRPDGGQFDCKYATARNSQMENDIEHYAAKTKEKMTREERVENLQNALFNGGYTEYEETNAEAYFGSLRESQGFLRAITQNRQEKTAWKGKEKLVDNYVGVAREYLQEGRFDLVLDGHYSDGRVREAEDLMRELKLSKAKVGTLLAKSLSSKNFVMSGANTSKYKENQGTVVMVFAPTLIRRKASVIDGKKVWESTAIDLYVKCVLNPHPDKSRGQTQFQVLSFREAKNKVCLYTGRKKNGRRRIKE